MTHLMTALIMTTMMMTFICPSSERQAAEPCLPIISFQTVGVGMGWLGTLTNNLLPFVLKVAPPSCSATKITSFALPDHE